MSRAPRSTRAPNPLETLPRAMDAFLIDGRDPHYEGVLGSSWKPRRLLGRGSNGVVGLWEYEGNDNKAVKQIAIKQIHTKGSSPLDESKCMDVLGMAKSIHVVRQYRNAAIANVKPAGGDVIVAMFLEYCGDGDLYSIAHNGGRGPVILEPDLWSLFYCLASANSVLDRGTEDVKSEPVLFGRDNGILVHSDLKPDNVFLGKRDPAHGRYPALKLGDFGNAELIGRSPRYKDSWRQPRNRGSKGYKAPENYAGHLLVSPRKGACTNTFQIGCIMYDLMRRDHLYPAMDPKQIWPRPWTRPKYVLKYTMGADLCKEPWASMYSRNLRDLIMECMMWEPDERPGTLELQERVFEAGGIAWDIADAQKFWERADVPPPVKSFQEPEGPGVWEKF